MALTLPIEDETTAGERRSAGVFQFDDNPTLRDVIRSRVRQEVERHNAGETPVFRGLVQPEESERILNGVRARPFVDWEKQYERALAAFESNGFLVLVDGRQILDLDETVHLEQQSRIGFLKLVPLIGG